ncbi:MmgE/PrpD family protein [Limoniibacter endophyticus]|nr:MmgE/PrpD family protein [Limoniibacter endophyticus]
MSALTQTLSEAIASADPLHDASAMKAGREAIVDYLACAIAGAADRSTLVVRDALGSAPGDAILIGSAEKRDAFSAALINGHAGHVLDYDDVHASVRGHPTAVIIPALLASGIAARADDFIAAYVVGLEVMARIGLALGTRHYENGFHATATLGPIGAAAAIARLQGLSVEKTAVALGLAATQSAGLRLQFGYDAKPLHVGLAARSGLSAARLAAVGFTGADDFLEGPIGFFEAFAFGAEQPLRVVENFGAPWQITAPGLTLKAFPCCTASHPVAVAALELRAKGLAAEDIDQAIITFPPGGDAALVAGPAPQNGIDARFSAEYVFAAALIDGKLGIDHFDERPTRADIRALAMRIERRHDETARRLSPDPTTRFVVLEVAKKDGAALSHRVDGLPSLADPAEKFIDATRGYAAFAEIPDFVRKMTDGRDLARLLALLNQPLSH